MSFLKYSPPVPISESQSDIAEAHEEQLLNSIFPPRKWTEGEQLVVQRVSIELPTRTEVKHLKESLGRKLNESKGTKAGVCPIRRELYSQVQDEMIRHESLICPPRGFLLTLVRDEARMVIDIYKTMYEKALDARENDTKARAQKVKGHMLGVISELEKEIRDLKKQLNCEKVQIGEAEKRNNEICQLDEKNHAAELQSLKVISHQVKAQLEMVKPKRAVREKIKK
ncbi:axonemal dynein light intermediate polypeptide 1-like [Aulostomus maculatus]